MIECKNVSVGYGKANIVNHISMKAEDGQITVILGKNGSGKTTLLRAVSGYLKYSGSITMDGLEVNELSVAQRSKLVSIMPQMLSKANITVRELVSFGRQPYTGKMGILSPKDKQIVSSVIETIGLAGLAHKKLNSISGGERQKAYFGMLLSQGTNHLLLDEPGSHLDPAYTNSLMEFLTAEKKKGKSILAVFHDINRTLEIADKIIVIQDQGVIFDGNCEEFYDSNIAEELFGLKKYLCTDQYNSLDKKYCYL